MKAAILGTRGIPNNYGGFEQLAEYLSLALTKKGHEVWVYNSSSHPYKEKQWKGVNLYHAGDPEKYIGTAGQFVYDLNCILHLRILKPDVILQLGYTSSSVWHRFLPKRSRIITNMDGLEWKRRKYSPLVQHFLKYAEALAVKSSDVLVADSVGIQTYLRQKYRIEAQFIAYGAVSFLEPDPSVVKGLNLLPGEYFMAVARFEPENNLETIIQGYLSSESKQPLLLIGNHNTAHGMFLKATYSDAKIIFHDPVYDLKILNNLRFYATLYFHGHSVGGTNPSLLEAMASQALVCAHDNIFNKSILENEAFYFSSREDITTCINRPDLQENRTGWIGQNLRKIENNFSWDLISDLYEKAMMP